MPDRLSKKGRSRNMAAIKCRDTSIELILRKKLYRMGFRYRINYNIKGRPDIVFISKKIAIFVDGDFWHGYNWKYLGTVPPKGFWQKKITTNIERDKAVTKYLENAGWVVLRFWEHDIKENLSICLTKIITVSKTRTKK